MSTSNGLSLLESCRERFDNALATEPRLFCVVTDKGSDDPSGPELPGWMCGMKLASVKSCSLSATTKKFETYFRPGEDHPPDYLPFELFSPIAEIAARSLLSLSQEAHTLIWHVGAPVTGDGCTLWLSAISELATCGRYPTLRANLWTWLGKERFDPRLMPYYQALDESRKNGGALPRYRGPRAGQHRVGAFLNDIYWASAEACRIIRALLRSSVTVSEIYLLQRLVTFAQDFPLREDDVRKRLGIDVDATTRSSFARLLDRGLVVTRQGRRSLIWLTAEGVNLALGLTNPNSHDSVSL